VVSVWDDGTVAMAIGLAVEGDRGAEAVVVDQLAIAGGSTLEPTGPLRLDDLLPGRPVPVQARFQVAADGKPRDVQIGGRFQSDGQRCSFAVVASATPAVTRPGPIATRPITVAKVRPADATWPTPPPPPASEPNAEQAFIPRGPLRNLMTAVPAESRISKLRDITGGPVRPPEQGGTSAAVFTRNNAAGTYGLTPPDPSVAATTSSGVVMLSANTAVSWSKDWGASFTLVNLTGITDPANPARTSFFPAKDGGLCCDQVLTYSQKHDLFIWVIQTWTSTIGSGPTATTGPNRLYLAWAKPAAVAADFLHAWSWIELDSALFGIGNDWMDYPDVTVSNDDVYLSVDRARGSSPISRFYSRWSLADLVDAGKSSVGGAFLELTDSGILKGHLARESPDTMYFAALLNSSTLRAYTWPDSSGSVTWFDVPMTSISFAYASSAPDGVSWNAGPVGILGGVLTRPQKLCLGGAESCDPTPQRVAWYAFPAGSDTARGRPQPYVRAVAIDMQAARLKTEVDIWNATVAFSTPSLEGACFYETCDIAVSLAVGGGGMYAENAVGFLYDWLVYTTTASDATQTFDCTPTGATTRSYCARYGDYFNLMPSQGPETANGHGYGYSTLGYSIRATTPGKPCGPGRCGATLQYVQFGRERTLIPSGRPR